MTAIDADATEDLLLDLEWHTEHRMDIGRDQRITMDKAMLIGMEAIDRHTGPAGLNAAPGAALPHVDLNATRQTIIQAIVCQDVQATQVGIELEDTGALGA